MFSAGLLPPHVPLDAPLSNPQKLSLTHRKATLLRNHEIEMLGTFA